MSNMNTTRVLKSHFFTMNPKIILATNANSLRVSLHSDFATKFLHIYLACSLLYSQYIIILDFVTLGKNYEIIIHNFLNLLVTCSSNNILLSSQFLKSFKQTLSQLRHSVL
jgi:hypothetical protein